jgi:DNA-binding response OmpR family regulator
MNILVIEDDIKIQKILNKGLSDNNKVTIVGNGIEGEELLLYNNFDVVVLDWMLPDKNGLEILKNIREKKNTTPILMLTAKTDINPKLEALSEGCDDYLSKPFSFAELELRLLSLYRRSKTNGQDIVNIKDIEIDITNKKVSKLDTILKLTQKEYELLLFLYKHSNSLISIDDIEKKLWTNISNNTSNVIQVTIYHLRKKIGKDIISSIRGMGYKLNV